MSAPARQNSRQRYDAFSMTLHWITAFSVIFLFASAHIWEQLEKGTPLRKGLQAWHISFGILLALVMIVRPLWRFYCQRQTHLAVAPAESNTPMRIIAHAVHGLLYLLLFTQVVLGFLFRWAQQEPFDFFGLFDIPTFIHVDTALRHTLAGLHNNVAWALISLAGAHALAALLHHYVLRDNVLRRMLPLRDSMPLREDK
ncbi:cytochrome b [Pantoea sp. JGM49]|jgi:Cytochrome B561|uniref:cytochrome b n=1 Tax=unclassified Pantoea TaxID=2630326 RepID=UPI000BD47BCF|nr:MULTISPECIES: cytochrome b [unclassified Pantoea]MBS0882060.1 cytochrome b [Pantoea sp. JGM49]SNY73901.1 cytochrome b561 [Pantoea sp. GL120224-02]